MNELLRPLLQAQSVCRGGVVIIGGVLTVVFRRCPLAGRAPQNSGLFRIGIGRRVPIWSRTRAVSSWPDLVGQGLADDASGTANE